MSSVTFGPPLVLDGPIPEAPARSLLSVPGVLQDPGNDPRLGNDQLRDRWMNGVSVYGYPEGAPLLWNPCSSGTWGTKSDESSFPEPDFGAFVAYVPLSCSAFSLASDPEAFGRRAELALDAIISMALEKALSQGIPTMDNPFLADAAVQIVAAGAQTPLAGLAYLEDAIGATGRAGMIHATPGTVTSWFATFPMSENETSLYTPAGTVVASGGGYQGAKPHGGAAAGPGEAWAFATGPVRAWVDSQTMLDIKDVLERDDNHVTFRAERYALVEWDTALQAAVLIDWGACPCPS